MLNIKFQKGWTKLKYSKDKRIILLQFSATFCNKAYFLECILPICNSSSERNCLDKLFLITWVNLIIYLRWAILLQKKIKHYPQSYTLGIQIALKWKWHYFLSSSIITTKLDIYVYKCKDNYICKSILQAICLVKINF